MKVREGTHQMRKGCVFIIVGTSRLKGTVKFLQLPHSKQTIGTNERTCWKNAHDAYQII